MEWVNAIFSAFGLSASAGLNAYIPLLMVGLLNRYTSWLDLADPYALLSNTWVLAVLGALTLVEVLADNIPVVNHVNDAIQTFVRPVAGAIVAAASSDAASVNPVLAVVAGLLVAGSVHATKSAVVRPAVTVSTVGLGNTPVSVTEDVVSATVSFLAVLIPIVVGVLLVVVVAPLAIWWIKRRRRFRSSA